MSQKSTLCLSLLLIAIFAVYTAFARNPGHRYNINDALEEVLNTSKNLQSTANFDPVPFTNYVDHFDPLNTKTWQQRTWVNDQYVKKGSEYKYTPIFITLCCEGQCSNKWVTPEATMIAQWAKESNGLLLAIEHRYYGESQPTEDWSVANLKYLTMEQALADAAHFIKTYVIPTHNPDQTKPVFVNGGSYGGLMAASMRNYYPNLVYGAIAASGVYDPRLDLSDLLTVAVDSFRFYGGDQCVDNISAGTAYLTEVLKNNKQEELDYVNGLLPLETPLTIEDSDLDRKAFWQLLTDSFIQVVQYNAENSPKYTVAKLCDEFVASKTQDGKGHFETYAEVHQKLMPGSKYRWTFAQQVEDIGDVKIGDPSRNMRQWWFQSSTAFGWFQPLIPSTQKVFGGAYDMDYFFQLVQASFGPEFTEEFVQDRITAQRSKLNQYHIMTSNVIFTSGSIDVWRSLATRRTNRDMNLYAYHIDRTAHCSPLYQPQTYDVLALRGARKSMWNNFVQILERYPYDLQGMNPGPLPL